MLYIQRQKFEARNYFNVYWERRYTERLATAKEVAAQSSQQTKPSAAKHLVAAALEADQRVIREKREEYANRAKLFAAALDILDDFFFAAVEERFTVTPDAKLGGAVEILDAR